jgi:hypothetical protein
MFSLANTFSVKWLFSKYLQNKNIEINTAKHNLKFLEDIWTKSPTNALLLTIITSWRTFWHLMSPSSGDIHREEHWMSTSDLVTHSQLNLHSSMPQDTTFTFNYTFIDT